MKAIVYHNYGSPDVLRLEELPKPKPRDNEVLVKIAAASVAAGDWHLLRAEPFIARFMSGLLRPKYKILGADVAGWVEAVGRNVKQFQPGDAVYGDLSACGFGGFAEYVAAPEGALAPKPARLSFEEAAAVPVSALTALQGLRDHGKLQPGQRVLINGASGGVGAFAVQIAKALGGEVTAVCSTSKVEMVRAFGVDDVIDYTKIDFTTLDQRYDLILAVNGYHPIGAYRRVLNPHGIYVMCGGTNAQMFQAILLGPLLSRRGGRKLGHMLATPNQRDLVLLSELIDAGQITPVIDRCYPLHQVAEAIRYVEKGHARGKVVITVAPQEKRAPKIGDAVG